MYQSRKIHLIILTDGIIRTNTGYLVQNVFQYKYKYQTNQFSKGQRLWLEDKLLKLWFNYIE